jgi:hypothetical protein
LVKIWPWKVNVGKFPLVIHSDGREEWLQTNVLPNSMEDPKLFLAIVCVAIGLGLILLLERIGKRKNHA